MASPMSRLRFIPLLLLASLLPVLASCDRKEAAAAGKGRAGGAPVPVLVATAERKDVPVILRGIGRVSSPATVALKAQVTGAIASVHFAEGQDVKEGELLFSIDERPFQTALAEAKAALAQAQARAENATLEAKRYTNLDRSGSVPQSEVDRTQAEAKVAASAVVMAQASVAKAELELAYCSVRAPVAGRTGKYAATPGNIVRANESELVTINQISPVDVTFSLAEQHLPAIRTGLAQGAMKVVATTTGENAQRAEGEVRFLDNSVRAATGTIELKGSFANQPPQLWPGQFVNVELHVGTDRGVVVVPSSAIQSGQTGTYVFVVGADQVAKIVPVTVDRTTDREAIVREGLAGGESVVTDGQSRLGAASKVVVKPSLEAAADAAAKAPARPQS